MHFVVGENVCSIVYKIWVFVCVNSSTTYEHIFPIKSLPTLNVIDFSMNQWQTQF